MKLTPEEIRLLAEQERKMDSGEQRYVLWHGKRVPFPAEILTYLGVVSGQCVSTTILVALMEENLLRVKAEIERKENSSENK